MKNNYFLKFIITSFLLILITYLINIKILYIIIALYLFIISLSRISSYVIYNNLLKNKRYLLFTGFIYLLLSLLMIFSSFNIYIILLLFSLILIENLLATNNLLDKNNVFIPSIYKTFKPYFTLFKQETESEKHNSRVEVLVHVRKTRRGMFGHTDLIIDGYVYSYGNYDNRTYKIKDSIGDGIIFKTKKEEYIKYCKSIGKTICCFGINYTDSEYEEIKNRLANMLSNTEEWNKEEIIKGTHSDNLNNNLNITFYKFNKNYHTKYFFLNYNCVKFIQEIIFPNQLDFTSIYTPGMLYSLLDNDRLKENTRILYKDIY